MAISIPIASVLAEAYLNISVAHIKAGLRGCNMTMAEEINRISRWLFTPNTSARDHMRPEGMVDAQIVEVADVM